MATYNRHKIGENNDKSDPKQGQTIIPYPSTTHVTSTFFLISCMFSIYLVCPYIPYCIYVMSYLTLCIVCIGVEGEEGVYLFLLYPGIKGKESVRR